MTEKPFFYAKFRNGHYQEAIEFARDVERQGFPGVFLASHADRAEMHADNVALSLAILDRTERITVGTGIATIYLRHAHSMASATSLIAELHPDRFLLGIGVSHVPMHEEIGVSHGKPLGDLQKYVETLRELQENAPAPRIIVAAMRQRMRALAGQIGDGVMWSTAPLSHMREAIESFPAERRQELLLGASTPVCVSVDPDAAHQAIRHYLHFYLKLPNYQRFFAETGFSDDVGRARKAIESGDDAAVRAAVSDRMVREIGISGTRSQVRRQLADWYETGLNFVVLDPVSTTGDPFKAPYEVLRAFANKSA